MTSIFSISSLLGSHGRLSYLESDQHDEVGYHRSIQSILTFFSNRSLVQHKTLSGSRKSLPTFLINILNEGWSRQANDEAMCTVSILDSRPFRHGSFVNVVYLVSFESAQYLCQIGGQFAHLCSIFEVNTETVYVVEKRQSESVQSFWPSFLRMYQEIDIKLLTASTLSHSIVLCEGVSAHLGTALVNEYSGLYFSEELAQVSGVKYSLCSFFHSFAACNLDHEHTSWKTLDYSHMSNVDVWKSIGLGCYLFLRPSCNYAINNKIIDRYFASSLSSAEDNISLSPSCIINLRQHTRSCPITPSDFEQLYIAISKAIPSVLILFDGMTSPTLRSFNKSERNILDMEVNFYKNLAIKIPSENFQIVAGLTMPAKIKIFRNSILSIQTYGSGFLYPYLLSIDTIMLSSFSHALNGKIYNELYDSCVPNFRLHTISQTYPTIPEIENIGLDSFAGIRNNTDLLKSGGYNENYVIDWKLLGKYIQNHFGSCSSKSP